MSYQGDLSKVVAIKAYRDEQLIGQPAKVQQMFGDVYIELEIDGMPTDLPVEISDEYVHDIFPFIVEL